MNRIWDKGLGLWSRRGLGALLLWGMSWLAGSVEAQSPDLFRIGFSAAALGEVNENDASAAVRIWAQALAQERGIPADPQPKILRGLAEVVSALTNRLIDGGNFTMAEYVALRHQVPLEHFIVSVKNNLITEEYVLLVHSASGIKKVADLHHRTLGILGAPRASLASIWIEGLLAKDGLDPAPRFFDRINTAPKLAKTVLPVFFRQLDACVVTRSGFETMIELNSQTGEQLKILAVSPPLVPVVFCFRREYTSPVREKVLAEIPRWHSTPAGRQILALFQTDTMKEVPESVLDSTVTFVESKGLGLTNRSAAGPGPSASGPENLGPK